MRILLVITKSDLGGAQTFVLHLARHLKQLGHHVEVVAGDGDFLLTELSKNAIDFQYIESLKRKANLLTSCQFIIEFYKYLKKNRFDVIHLNSTNTLLATISVLFLRFRPKVVFTVHGLSLVDNNSRVNTMLQWIFRTFYKIFLPLTNKVVFVCNTNLKEALQKKIVTSGEVIYNGIATRDMTYLSQSDSKKFFLEHYNIDFSNAFILGSIGRLAHQKHYDFLIQTFPKIKKLIPNAKVIIIGDGPNANIYREMIKTDPIYKDFHLIGPLHYSYQYLKAFDVFVLPSIFEGLSISLLEALFADLPILASNIGGNGEIVNEYEAELFTLDNEGEFLHRLEHIKNNKQKFVEYNQLRKPVFEIEKMVGGYISVYESLLK